MEYLDSIVSALALLLSIYVYITYGRKINKQQETLNEQQEIINQTIIKEAEEKDKKNKQAEIVGNFYSKGPGKRCLRVYNKGISSARNIRIIGLEQKNIFIRGIEDLPFSLLNPQDGFDLIFHICSGCPNKVHIKYIWDDEYKKDNEREQILQI